MKKGHLMAALLSCAMLTGCGSSIESLSNQTAKHLLAESIEKGQVGDVVKVTKADLAVENSDDGDRVSQLEPGEELVTG